MSRTPESTPRSIPNNATRDGEWLRFDYGDSRPIWQRECPDCDFGLLYEPVRDCPRCGGGGYLTTDVRPT